MNIELVKGLWIQQQDYNFHLKVSYIENVHQGEVKDVKKVTGPPSRNLVLDFSVLSSLEC